MTHLTKSEMSALMPGFNYAKPRAKPTYKEADLHLSFCKYLKRVHPKLVFVRHEKEGKRTKFLQGLVKVYNSGSGLPDFELLHGNGLYIEFKKPGEKWLLKDGQTVKPDYAHQYEFHVHLWSIGRCAYFCNELEDAIKILEAYLAGKPLNRQVYNCEKDLF